MIASWIMILAFTGDCGSSPRCAPTVTVSEIGPFETKEACLAAANLSLKTFRFSVPYKRHSTVSPSSVRARAVCFSTGKK